MEMNRELAIKILGLQDAYSEKELKTRYRLLSKILHPDVKGDSKLFLLIGECYTYLCNNNSEIDSKENKYDEHSAEEDEINDRYTTLPFLYENFLWFEKYTREYNIIQIRSEVFVLVKPILSKKDYTTTVNLRSDFKSFLSTSSVIFEENIILPDYLSEYTYFQLKIIFLGKTYKKLLRLNNDTKGKRCSIKYDSYRHFNSFVELSFFKGTPPK